MSMTASAAVATTASASVITATTASAAMKFMTVSDTQYQIEQWYQSKSQYHGGEYSSCQ
jgi:hypothetical protein